jgi:hypothetical protein
MKVCRVKSGKLVCKTSKKMAGMRRRSRKMSGLGASCRTAKGKFKKC